MLGKGVLWLIRKIKRFTAKKQTFPMTISLPFKEGTLLFEVNNPVEWYRTAEFGDEKEFLDQFVLAIQPNDVVFDIGASVGLMTVYAASAARKGRVFAFEPDPETMTRLERNVRLNALSNVELRKRFSAPTL
jgi:predicted O-methyltransferase YrrM